MSTNMWILTNGLNCGATSYICSAVEYESRKAKVKSLYSMDTFPMVIGISNQNDLVYGETLCDRESAKVAQIILV